MQKTEISYAGITELPGLAASQEQIERLYQRYRFARQFADEKDVLEVACGSGMGLPYLIALARSVLGVDIDGKNISVARELCRGAAGVRVERMDAHRLDVADASLDTVLFFEALYYLKDPARFMAEAFRVLRPSGRLVICTVNKEWEDFHPSPFSHAYFTASELYDLMTSVFGSTALYAGIPVERDGVKDRVVSFIKRVAIKYDLIPGSLAARAHLKRIFMGKLALLPERISDGMAKYREPVRISADRPCTDFKIIYGVAVKK